MHIVHISPNLRFIQNENILQLRGCLDAEEKERFKVRGE